MTTTYIQENVNNLTSIWKLIGTIYNAHNTQKEIEWVDMNTKTWPNRLWINSPITPSFLKKAKQILQSTSTSILIPYYSNTPETTNAFFSTHGFQPQFQQIGMSLKLDKTFPIQSNIQLKRVETEEEAKLWSQYFEQSFGYFICPDTINVTKTTIEYYLTYSNLDPVGTLILHQTNTFLGIHAMGVLPHMRRKGLADQIMKTIINLSKNRQADTITLQASELGKKVYDKLGFTTDFTLITYSLKG